ncbi:Cyclin-dependent kinase F-1 [Glycine max]|nr:Cyclin-dependent kinase F-1 [Glycine max]
MKTKSYFYDTNKDTNIYNGNTSCLVACTMSDIDDDLCKGSFTYEAEEVGGNELGCLTSCVRTWWFQVAELLYGSTYYGLEIDLWSLGCVFAKILTSKPLFPGTSDVDQLSRIVSVLGNVEKPSSLEACMPNCYPNEVSLVQRLVCYDPTKRTTTMELLQDKYFSEEPLPVPISELRVPLTRNGHDQDSPGGPNEMGLDSDLEEFGTLNITTTSSDLSKQIP